MKVGIPRALLYHNFGELWNGFFDRLGIETVISPPTNKAIIKSGNANSIDEACYSSKIYIGHVHYLLDKCDLIFVPRIESTGIREEYCTRLFGIYDLVRNTFPKARLLHADINYLMRRREPDAFVKIGAALLKTPDESLAAYNDALAAYNNNRLLAISAQDLMLENSGPKVLIASHAYNSYDATIGKQITDYFSRAGISVAFADVIDLKDATARAKEISSRIYWRVNMEIIGGVLKYKDAVDGIILISTFPCGPDAITNELIIRTVKDKPILNIMFDELSSDTGLATRLESFTDVITANRRISYEHK